MVESEGWQNIHFVGPCAPEKVSGFYRKASALILPSLVEPWGLVVNEAMQSGLPVLVSTHCGCAPDLVREGENGLTFDPTDEDSMVGCLTRFFEMSADARAAMGQCSRTIIAGFTPAVAARQMLEGLNLVGFPKPRGLTAAETLV
jgi:glycosyltransferase involved in cell wall biosynthesis